MTSKTIPPEDEITALAHDLETVILRRLHKDRIAGYSLEMSRELAGIALQSRRSQPDREAIIEECAKVAEGKKPIVAGHYYRGQREQSDKIANAIRSLKHSDTTPDGN